MKRILPLLLGILFTLSFSGHLCAKEPRKPMGDDEISRQLLGTWLAKGAWEADVPVNVVGMITFTPDGKSTEQGVLTIGRADKRPFEYETTWKVENGILIETLTKSNQPILFRVGANSRDKIIRIDAKRLTYRMESGRVVTHQRKPAA